MWKKKKSSCFHETKQYFWKGLIETNCFKKAVFKLGLGKKTVKIGEKTLKQ